MKFRKKPVVIEAVQFRAGEQPHELAADVVAGTVRYPEDGTLLIETLEGTMQANPGDWIIRGVKGELYPCKPDIFAATYEDAASPAPSPAGESRAVVLPDAKAGGVIDPDTGWYPREQLIVLAETCRLNSEHADGATVENSASAWKEVSQQLSEVAARLPPPPTTGDAREGQGDG